MKFNLPLNNFTSGEWSPKMSSRTDTEQYVNSCKEVTNMFIQMHGGAQYRGGTKYVDTIQSTESANLVNTNEIATIPYIYGGSKVFLCLQRKAASVVTVATLITISGAIYPLITAGAHQNYLPDQLQYTQIGLYLFITDTRGLYAPMVFYLNIFSPSSLEFHLFAYNSIAFAGANKVYDRLPWSEAEALGSSVTFTHSGATAVAGACTITASAAYFAAGDVGRYIRLCSGTSSAGVLQITTFTSTTVVQGIVTETIPAVGAYGSTGAPTTFWQITEWGNSKWPKCVVGHEQRLIFGSTDNKPMTMWGSRIGNIFDFVEIPSPSTTGIYGFASSSFLNDNSRPFTLTPAVSTARNIVSLASGKTLEIHTDENEIVAYGNGGSIGPNNISFESSTAHGSNSVMPVRTAGFSTFVQKNGVKIRDLIYNDTEAAYKASDLSFVVDHFFVNKGQASRDEIIKIVKYQDTGSSYLIVHTESGKCYYVTLDRDYKVNAWGRIYLANGYGTDPYVEQAYPYNGQAKILSVAELGGSLYFFVSRTNPTLGTDVSIEYLAESWDTTMVETITSGTELPTYLDCSSTYTFSVATATPTVNAIYRSQLVSVVADNAYIGEYLVSAAGVITLPRAYKSFVVGFIYTGVIMPNPPQVGGQIGIPLGRIKRVDEIAIKFVNTNNAKVGFEGGYLETIPFRENSETMDLSTTYKTDTKVVHIPSDYSREPVIVVKQDKPYPMYIASIAARGVTYD